jgi:hypothetical protein
MESSRKTLLATIVKSVEDADLNCNELQDLSISITNLYAIKANVIVQHLPSEIWHSIFQSANLPKISLKELLSYRTVCQTWDTTIRQLPKIHVSRHYDINKLAGIFAFRTLPLRENVTLDCSLLTQLQHLIIKRNLAVDAQATGKWFSLTTVGTLNELSLRNPRSFSDDCLLPLTNLTKLTLSSFEISSISSLTNLCSLEVQIPILFRRSDTLHLTKLVSVVSNVKSFFDCGTGTFQDGDGITKYAGSWQKSYYHGKGILWTQNQERIEGTFDRGSLAGHGSVLYRDGSRYEGDLLGTIPSGHGIMKYPNGSKYEGSWANSGQYLHGTWTDATGEKYVGGFLYGYRNGRGVCYYPNGEKHDVEWKNNVPHGQGILNLPDGGVFKGFWVFGKKHGWGVTILINQGGEEKRDIQQWKNGELVLPEHHDPDQFYDIELLEGTAVSS